MILLKVPVPYPPEQPSNPRPASHKQVTQSVPDTWNEDGSKEVSVRLSKDDFRLILGALYLHRRRLVDLNGARQSIRADEIALLIQDELAGDRRPATRAPVRNACAPPAL